MSVEALEVELEEQEQPEEEVAEHEGEEDQPNSEQEGEEPQDEVVVTIGDEQPVDEVSKAPEWVRELRKSDREKAKLIRELQAQLQATNSAAQQELTLGKKPTLEEFDYDAERFEGALATWYEQKRKVDEQKAKQEQEANAAKEAWNATLSKYGKLKTELRVKDFDDAEMTVQEALNQTQQGIILQGAENPALLIYALGKNQKKAQELAAIKDPVKYAFAVAKLETQLKVASRKAPPPERQVTGSAPISGSVDSTLERLRAEAEKTNDYTKVYRYKASLKGKQ